MCVVMTTKCREEAVPMGILLREFETRKVYGQFITMTPKKVKTLRAVIGILNRVQGWSMLLPKD